MPNPVSPDIIINLIKSGSNPQELVMKYLEGQLRGTPMGDNLLSLAKSNNTAQIEQIARNIMKSQGRDFDQEFNTFKRQLGIK